MLDFGANPVEHQLILSAQFLHNELPVRLAHRVAELENLPYGLSAKPHVLKVCPRPPEFEGVMTVLQREATHTSKASIIPSCGVQVRDWYVESFADLRAFPRIKNAEDEAKFTDMLRKIYIRHR